MMSSSAILTMSVEAGMVDFTEQLNLNYQMEKSSHPYDPTKHETSIYTLWRQANAFAPKPAKGKKKPFVVMLPPPNVTGSLHMGHALQDTLIDTLIRYHRMKGEETLWLPGTDHAAIATNKVIENQLHQEGKTRHDIGREAFLQRTEEWYEKTGNYIIKQMERLGCSADWSRTRFTMDKDYYHAVQEAFIRYYQKGYIYRGMRLVNWDAATQTTVSDLEVEWRTEKAPFYTLRYGPFTIGTARPETKFGDKYVVMHPDDARYARYTHGQTITVEWIHGPITATIIKDEAVDQSFGTGAMTITPWHDATDFEIAQRHKLDMEQIIDNHGKLLPIAGEFAGLNVTHARPKIVEKLQQKGLVVSVSENYEHNVAINERGKGVIEPQVMRQWFVDMSKLKKEAMVVAEKELTRFIPPRWKKHFLHWLENVRDWNINRQIWLGHRLPVWWKKETHGTDHEQGNYVVSIEKPPGSWQQDPDVLDTWFSSALWPFASLGWPDTTKDLERYYPTSVLITAREILYLWVARMMFSGLELMRGEKYGSRAQKQRLPFKDVVIHPVVLAKNGQRMSKSLGTGVDPLELIDTYGADATRFGLMMQLNYDQQAMKFDEAAIRAARNFANKIWNIARFLKNMPDRSGPPTPADKWIQWRLQQVGSQVTKLLEEYKVGESARLLHEHIWHDLADWYIEILKSEGSPKVARQVFNDLLTLLHPYMPHLTEALWQEQASGHLLMHAPWPTFRRRTGAPAHTGIEYFKEVVTAIRSAKVLLGIKAGMVLQLKTEKEISLPIALQKLTGASLVRKISTPSVRIPLASGGMIVLGSSALTAAQINSAKRKLTAEKLQLEKNMAQQQALIEHMRQRAPEEVIVEKEKQVELLQRRAAQTQRSIDALSVDNEAASAA